jgi:hypothetical protein
MAAILQLRRGTTAAKPTLSAGEMYVNTTSQSLQVGIDGSTEITLAKLNSVNSGSFNVSGDITLGGTITIGDNTVDNVVFNADLSSSIIPNNDNTFDLGNPSNKYRSIFATSISGAIASTNGVISGSSQLNVLNAYTASANIWSGSIDNKFITLLSVTASYNTATASLNTFSASVNGHIVDINTKTGSFETKNTSLATISGSLILTASFLEAKNLSLATITGSLISTASFVEAKNLSLATITGSLISTASFLESKNVSLATISGSLISTASFLEGKNLSLATITGSLISTASFVEGKNLTIASVTASYNSVTASLNTYTASAENKFSSIAASTSSINSYTASLKTALTASGADVTINGNLTVAGTTTTINSQTLNIGDNIIELNYGGTAVRSGIYTKDATGGSLTSGSFLWDATNDFWIAGVSGSESKVLRAGSDFVISGSIQVLGGSGVWSGSAQLPSGVVSGSIQVLGGSGVWSGSAQLPSGLVSGSSQLTSSFDLRYAQTGSNTLTGNQIITGSLTITGSAKGNIVPITISSLTASLDMNLGSYFTLTLADTVTTHIRATNITPGISATLLITTGTNSTASLSPVLLQPSGSAYSSSIGVGKKDVLSLVSFDSTNMYVVSTKAMQ